MKVQLLKEKNFSLLMFGKITSLFGSTMQSFALGLYVLATTGSATKFASIVAITIIPQIILGPIAGVFVDRFYRKKILVNLDLLSGVVVSIFAAIYFIKGELDIGYIYVLVIALSVISTLFQPALETIIPTISKKEDLIEANSFNSLIMSIGQIVAPALAGIVYGAFGLKVVFIMNALTFFISSFSECFIDIPKVNIKNEKMNFNIFLTDFKDGLKFTFSKKKIMSIALLATVLNFGLGSIGIGYTFILKNILKVSDYQYGLAESLSGMSALFASVCASYLGKKYGYGKNIYRSLLGEGVVILLFALVVFEPFLHLFSSNLIPFILTIAVVFMLSLLVTIANIFIGSYKQSIVPLEYMGRVNTVMGTAVMVAYPLSNMMFGILFDKINPSMIFTLSFIIIIVPVLCFKNILLSVEKEKDEVEAEFA